MKKFQTQFINFLNCANFTDFALLMLRVFTGLMLITHGAAKIADFGNLSANFPDPIGLGSKLSFILVVGAEVGCSALVILGLFTKLAVILIIFSMVVAAFIVHSPFTVSGSELPLIYLVVFTALFFTGPGKFSVDRLFLRSSANTSGTTTDQSGCRI